MNNTCFFLRHAETIPDEDLPISKWILTEDGKRKAEELAQTSIFGPLEIIISSDEEKAYQTAKPFAERTGIEVIRTAGFNELDRDKGNFLGKEEYQRTVRRCFTNMDKSFNNWETANHALERFSREFEEVDSKFSNKSILIVSHGCVINLYFAKILNKLDNVFERWLSNSFCDFGIIKNSDEVIKDIARY